MLFGDDGDGVQYGTIGGLGEQLRELREVRAPACSAQASVAWVLNFDGLCFA